MNLPTTWVNGRWIDASQQPAIASEDRGFLHGHGVFETIGARAGDLPLWRWHARRLLRGGARLGLPGEPPPDLRQVASEAVMRSGDPDSIVRITWTAGDGHIPTFVVATRARVARPVVRLCVAAMRREGADALADVKHTSRAFYSAVLGEARARGCDDAVILDDRDLVLESTTANLFWIGDGEWRTPGGHGAMLAGIARMLLLDAFASRGSAAREGAFSCNELVGADELCVVNAVYGPRAATLSEAPVEPLDSDHPLVRAWCGILDRG